ncbi:hypothetical protein KSS87_001050 [Heliosperma pusillum]|nr:hypothetical protein KSS87_001050 [Heliosperma pusillum]
MKPWVNETRRTNFTQRVTIQTNGVMKQGRLIVHTRSYNANNG